MDIHPTRIMGTGNLVLPSVGGPPRLWSVPEDPRSALWSRTPYAPGDLPGNRDLVTPGMGLQAGQGKWPEGSPPRAYPWSRHEFLGAPGTEVFVAVNRAWLFIAVLLALIESNSVRSEGPALDLALEGGISPRRNVDLRRVNLRPPWAFEKPLAGGWRLLLRSEGAAGKMRARSSPSKGHRSLKEASLRGVAQAVVGKGNHWFVEAGTGAVYLSERVIGQLNLGSRFQFRSHIGAGLFLGQRARWWLAWRYSHTSNAGLGSPNPGINFHMLQLGHSFGLGRP